MEAVVTGAGRGLGAEVSRQLAAQGWHVVVAARDGAAAQAVVDEITGAGGRATATVVDLGDPGGIRGLADLLGDRPLDALVNNAAAFADWGETPSSTDLAAARAVMETNLFGTWAVTQALLPALRRAGTARIVNVTSGAGSHGEAQFGLAAGPTATSYAVSKAALNALTVKLAAELSPAGLLVNAVDPGLTATAPGMAAMGARPVPEGAAGIVWAATLPAGGPTGGFFRDGRPLPW